VTDCVFCEIVAGTAPATIVREWDDALALVPLDPVCDGHLIVIPKVHVADATTDFEVTVDTMYRALELVAEDAHANILTSIGEHATQSIFHLHIHVVTRRKNDKLMLPWGTTGDPHLPHRCKGMDERDEALARVNKARN
jgi:histidine triad (HIT) family protein